MKKIDRSELREAAAKTALPKAQGQGGSTQVFYNVRTGRIFSVWNQDGSWAISEDPENVCIADTEFRLSMETLKNLATRAALKRSKENRKMKYYVIETEYVGPNRDYESLNYHRLEVRTVPARGNLSREPIIDGWCGSTDDYSVRAHGEFDSLVAADAHIKAKFTVRYDEDFARDNLDEDTIARFYVGDRPTLDASTTRDYIYEAIRAEVMADWSDEQCESWAKACQANEDDYYLNVDTVERLAIDRRDALLEEMQDD